jgi:polysaccharide pyruvyl transferase WcaK-like protein
MDMNRPVVITHAYDSRNRGDGLLVAETVHALERAGVPQSECYIIACNASTFDYSNAALQYPMLGVTGMRRLRGSLAFSMLALGSLGYGNPGSTTEIGRILDRARLIVGVGGGYLRAPGGRESLQTQLVHVPQLLMAERSDCPVIYLPQSIGPLSGFVGQTIRRAVNRLDLVMARDQRTIEEIGGNNVERFPDLAILKIGREFKGQPRHVGGGAIVGMARNLESEAYRDRIKQLSNLIPIIWLSHSSVDNQDDSKFYRECGLKHEGTTDGALSDGTAAVAVSVRLHGALQSILAGIPAIHLSYERKGPGAYEDLGLMEWVHSARAFSPELVAKQARELAEDPSEYWSRIGEATDRIVELDHSLVEKIRAMS